VRCRTSRTPVREACTRLMQDQWLSRIPRKGFMVTPISVRDIIDSTSTGNCLSVSPLKRWRDRYSRTNRGVALHRSSRERAARQPGDILRANTQFHRRLSELAGNERVTSQLQLTLGYVSRLDTLCTQTVPDGSVMPTFLEPSSPTRQPKRAPRWKRI